MVEPAVSLGGHAVEEFLGGGGVGQGHLKLACVGQGQVQILLVKGNAETGVERPLDHPRAVNFENLGGCETAHQRLPNLRRIIAFLGCE